MFGRAIITLGIGPHSCSLSYLSRRHLVCFFAICGKQHSVLFLQLVATILHCTGGLIELLKPETNNKY